LLDSLRSRDVTDDVAADDNDDGDDGEDGEDGDDGEDGEDGDDGDGGNAGSDDAADACKSLMPTPPPLLLPFLLCLYRTAENAGIWTSKDSGLMS
jgi:hypothetical protein